MREAHRERPRPPREGGDWAVWVDHGASPVSAAATILLLQVSAAAALPAT